MSNRLATLYAELRMISLAREVAMMAGSLPTKYNLEKGQEIIQEIIVEEGISKHQEGRKNYR